MQTGKLACRLAGTASRVGYLQRLPSLARMAGLDAMKTAHLTFALALGMAATAQAQSDASLERFQAAEALFSESNPLCSGHVKGVPTPDGKPGLHIVWRSYTTQDSLAAMQAQLSKVLQQAPDTSDPHCPTWRRGSGPARATISLCQPSSVGPWTHCGAPIPPATQAMVTFSDASGPDK